MLRPAGRTLGLALWAAASAGLGQTGSAHAGPAEPLAVATDVRLGGDEAETRFIVDLTKQVDVVAFSLADPFRVVLDLPQVNFALPAKAGESGRGLVKAFRFGLLMQGASRIVLDLTGPARVEKAFVLPAADGEPARLVVDLVSTDRDSFMRNVALEAKPRAEAAPLERDATKSQDSRPLIMLDPGHGGVDSGTMAGRGETEKAIVLTFALKLREKLEKTGKYRVAMTRVDDRFVPLAQRVQMARAQKAALFLSIHADALAHHDADARGATVYTLSETASDAEAARLADAENRADVIAGVDLSAEPNDVADILIDLAQRETKSFSLYFARTLVNEIKSAARLHKHPLKSAGFRVLKAPDVPSVLIELGYVSNGSDLKLMTSEAWRARLTDAVLAAISGYFATRIAGTAGPPGSN